MPYIFDNDNVYTKKCETLECPNEIFVTVSSKYCRDCYNVKDVTKIQAKFVPYFYQRFIQ